MFKLEATLEHRKENARADRKIRTWRLVGTEEQKPLGSLHSDPSKSPNLRNSHSPGAREKYQSINQETFIKYLLYFRPRIKHWKNKKRQKIVSTLNELTV